MGAVCLDQHRTSAGGYSIHSPPNRLVLGVASAEMHPFSWVGATSAATGRAQPAVVGRQRGVRVRGMWSLEGWDEHFELGIQA